MPKFLLNKLIRDKLVDEYTRLNQMATYKTLSDSELLEALRQKIFEELQEIPLNGSLDDFEKEIADTQQALDDLVALRGASPEQIQSIRLSKAEKKGGFTGAHYVETLELAEDDEWVAYYRAEPKRYKEL